MISIKTQTCVSVLGISLIAVNSNWTFNAVNCIGISVIFAFTSKFFDAFCMECESKPSLEIIIIHCMELSDSYFMLILSYFFLVCMFFLMFGFVFFAHCLEFETILNLNVWIKSNEKGVSSDSSQKDDKKRRFKNQWL